ncbi:DEAD/DEAH box helicase [Helicobacter pylori]|uniref:DEAD/DEAH box helicase n=1 Tax=Helicobacter pylori TaxID=210 RepID=UPI0002BBD3AC|nr:DEAD/DEAH box helicase [Helicobacter pylori]EMH09091.1 helicase protein [Helicobacter pylori GAM250AFi]EMH11885.1 helicase protein [Helicobacter pylori GAM250T]EMH13885.1 helicase protein [Helicobacter pylori GAM252T]EMH15644.1 helicase protein [Helicobacter pylori GAM252Bi]EMH45459.1 helicase protein [Helicobacter pylori HP250AFii]
MQEISAYELIKQKLHAIPNQRHKGSLFEKISKQFLQEHDSANEYESIDLWYDWQLRGKERDKGIDIVITTSNQEYIAVQCKFHQNSISYNDISPFLTQLLSGVGGVKFKKGIIISTSNLTSEALKEIEKIRSTGMGIDIDEITEEDFIYSRIDWEKFDPTKTEDEIPLCDKKRPRPHQTEAIEETKKYFSDPKNARGKLIMACGTGKTYTSLKIMESLDPKITLFLAPSIALLSQTFREYAQEKSEPFYASIVCSDNKTGQSKNEDNDDIKFSELPLKASTRLEDILSTYEKAQKENKRFIIFSTYQSALRIKEVQEAGLNGIDLIICDEAHRTVGAMYSTNERDDKNAFTLCHSDGNIKAKKRLYMTATPKVYSESSKAKAKESDNVIYSMDDAEVFGEEIYTLNFERAIALDLLTDYKVIILAVRSENLSGVTNSVNKKISQLEAKGTKLDKKLINNEFVCKIVGTHKGLAKQDVIALDDENKEDNDLKNKADTFVSQRAISFCKSIQTSKNIKDSFETIMECYDEELKKKSFKNLKISIDHVDGTMNCKERLDKLEKLNQFEPNICKVLSNARCLSEGVDVPALDSVIFFDGRSAMVDIIQAVGRVMRKAKNKKRGYIILPIALKESEIKNLDEAVKNTNFQNIWKVLKALRSHDSSLVDEAIFKEKIKIFGSDDTSNLDDEEELQKDKTEQSDPKQAQKTLFDAILLQDLANAVYNVMPTKLGDRNYWENFAKKTGNIAKTLNNRLKELFGKNPEIFDNFLTSLRGNIHQNIKEEEALDMIISHIITKPIFDAIFGDNIQNPIAKALDKMVLKLSDLGLEGETKDLKNLYESVKTEAARAKSQKSQQELIKNLYNTFFKEAFRKQSEKLGIVYTPIEVVDFILRATNGILKKHFNTDFNDQNITIFDPFTGTGSFIARLLSKENDLISDEALKEKFQNHLFAFDIVLLSYYIALINITQAAQNRDSSLKNFKNIALTDSLDYLEEKSDKGVIPGFEDLKENKEIKNTLADQKIQVIIGNPPYSSGAKSENDNNQNLTHPKLEKWVYETYGKNSTAQNKNSTRDTLIHSIRMASDLLKDKGVLGFVVNGSFIDSKSADGFRKCVAKEFSHLYALNLRGNARTSGEERKKQGDGIFDSGSRATVAVIFFVKDTNAPNHTIFYYEVEDYLTREAKLNLLAGFENLDLVPFKEITPNDKGDWINQRNDDFEKLIPLKRDKTLKIFDTIFDLNSNGVKTNRDPWVYNFSPNALKQSVQNCIDTYNADLKRFNERFREAFKQRTAKDKGIKPADRYKHLNDREITTDKTKISWTDGLKNKLIKNENLPESGMERIRLALYRPFNKQWLYWDKDLITRQGRFSKIFPDKSARNVVINTGMGNGKDFSALVSDFISDLSLISPNQAYPLYYYDDLGNRYNAISGYALNLFRRHYQDNAITEEEIFYYIYAIFHHKGYLEKYKNSLAKEAPRIALSEDFKELSILGKELAELHLKYENGEMHTSVKHNLLENAGMEGYYDVVKMTKKGDRIIYNHHITITQIPKKAFDYVVNGKSAIDWVIERYSITTDKDSLIENNPNHYAGGQYIFELLCRVIKLSEKSVDLIEKISEKRFE